MSAPRLFSWLLATAAALVTQVVHAQQVGEFEGTYIGGGPNGTNVLNNTCSRLFSQAVIKDGSAWVDGGINIFAQYQYQNPNWVQPNLDTIIAGVNEYVIQTPLNKTWDWKKDVLQIAHEKQNNPRTNSAPPIVMQGALYSGITGDPRIWLFGGTTSYINTSFPGWQIPQPDQYTLWSYDTGTDVWDQYDVYSYGVKTRPSNGAHAEAPDMGLAFWLDGEVNSGSSSESQPLGDDGVYLEQGLVVLDLNGEDVTVQNVSTSKMGSPRVGGDMIYVPTIGEKGLLVMIGGGNSSTSNNATEPLGAYMPMDDIWVYDVAAANATDPTSGLYSQKANGIIPQPRQDFCLVGIDAPDSSSFTIYLYGGRQGDTLYDQSYALSLPSFTWSLIYEGASPRYGHSCAMASQRQMMTFGGSNTTAIHDTCDWEVRGMALYDFSDNIWGSTFILPEDNKPYTLPRNVSKSIGGDSAGHATKFEPDGGFSSKALAQVMKTRPSQGQDQQRHHGLSGGAIAGIVIGVLAGVAILAALLFWFVVRPRRNARKKAQRDDAQHSDQEARPELDSEALSNEPRHAEADGQEIVAFEKDSNVVRPEMDDTEMRFEMDAAEPEVRAELGGDTHKPPVAAEAKKGLF